MKYSCLQLWRHCHQPHQAVQFKNTPLFHSPKNVLPALSWGSEGDLGIWTRSNCTFNRAVQLLLAFFWGIVTISTNSWAFAGFSNINWDVSWLSPQPAQNSFSCLLSYLLPLNLLFHLPTSYLPIFFLTVGCMSFWKPICCHSSLGEMQ